MRSAVGGRPADILGNPLGRQKRPLLMATGTKTPLLTRKGLEHLVRTTGALVHGRIRSGAHRCRLGDDELKGVNRTANGRHETCQRELEFSQDLASRFVK